jgi:photosystem I subunit 4
MTKMTPALEMQESKKMSEVQKDPKINSTEDDTPIEASERETGHPIDSNAKSSATPESGSNADVVVGSPNQGTEKR